MLNAIPKMFSTTFSCMDGLKKVTGHLCEVLVYASCIHYANTVGAAKHD